jgi:predicted Zn-dependent protease
MTHIDSEQTVRILRHDDVKRIVDRIQDFASGGGAISIAVRSWWNGELRWARNRVNLASDRRDVRVWVRRRLGGSLTVGDMETNQIDDDALLATVRAAERSAGLRPFREARDMPLEVSPLPYPTTTIWSDATYNVTAAERGKIGQALARGAESKGMMSAGYLEMRAGEVAVFSTQGDELPANTIRYDTYTQAQCSMTVRHPKGVGSGWAGLSSFDWSAIDSEALADRALEKCLASLDPVAIEPGRYTVILEPQAVCDLVEFLQHEIGGPLERGTPEDGRGPLVLGPDHSLNLIRSKLGLKIVDERITIEHDPLDPALGIVPQPGLASEKWIDRGVLVAISYGRQYARQKLREDTPSVGRTAFRMSGGTTTMEEMISTTKRGLLVTRFSNLQRLDWPSLLYTGVTRDGLWLIENGKITKTVKNLRMTESPLFALNQVEHLGVPVPVFRPIKDPYSAYLTPTIVPPIKVNDFSFTSMIDAV